MSLSAAELARVVAELQPLVGAPIQRTWAPEPRTAVLQLRVPGETHLLLVSAEAFATRIHRVADRPRWGPAPFQDALRAEVEGLRLAGLEQTPGDRVVRLALEGPDRRRTLVAELTGRHGNLFVLDETGTVLHSAVPNLSQRRENVRGHAYVPPRAPPGPDEAVRFQAGPGPFGFNAAVAARYEPEAEARRLDARRREIAQPVKSALKRVGRTLKKVEADARRAAEADVYRRRGELLKAELHRVRRGQTGVEVTDWFEPDAPRARIPLRPELGPQENLAHLFHLYNRYKGAPDRIEARRRELAAEGARLEALLERLEAAWDPGALGALETEARQAGYVAQAPPGRRAAAARLPYRRYRSARGRDILVGRGAKDNHALTFKVARGNDVWMHARGWQGSHVVIPTAAGPVDEQTLLDGAHLALHFSGARGEPGAEVTWTWRKHVRHPKGAPPGLVTYADAHNLDLRVEPERLARLLAAEVRDPGA